jgi:hypothetical protein
MHSLVERLGHDHCQYIDVERAASTPERFFRAVTTSSPFPTVASETPRTAREAFELTLSHLSRAGTANRPATIVLDEVLELRTFESFPGLRHVQRELLQSLADSSNRFVLTSRYVARDSR